MKQSSLSEFEEQYETDEHLRRFFPYRGCELSSIALSMLCWPDGTLQYSEIEGGLVNKASSIGDELVIGSIITGNVGININRTDYSVNAFDSVIFYPGDAAIQAMRDARLFTLRLTNASGLLFRISAMPFKSRQNLPRKLPWEFSQDLLRLFAVTSEEYDRTKREDGSVADQISVLGKAIEARIALYIDGLSTDLEPAEPAMLKICTECSHYVAQNRHRRVSTKEMADAGLCSVRTLHRAFEQVAQTTPAEYQTRVRLNYARSLITTRSDSEMPLSEVAEACGFYSTTHLSRAYTVEYTISPTKTRVAQEAILASFV